MLKGILVNILGKAQSFRKFIIFKDNYELKGLSWSSLATIHCVAILDTQINFKDSKN